MGCKGGSTDAILQPSITPIYLLMRTNNKAARVKMRIIKICKLR